MPVVLFGALLLGGAVSVRADVVHVAVAANFALPIKDIIAQFEDQSGHEVKLSLASTGKLYAQIEAGAPYDVFLAADQRRPAMAIENGLAVAGSAFTYAYGSLVLYSAQNNRFGEDPVPFLKVIERLAITNPATAPYGQAAVETLQHLGLYQDIESRIVRGNSVTQSYQFVFTGNVEAAFVAASQVVDKTAGSIWQVPQDHHAPLKQDAVLLERGKDNPAALAFMDHLVSPAVRSIKKRYGYALPDE